MLGDTCGVCGNQLFWWRSRSGYRVCMACHPDPLAALEILARRGQPGMVQRVQAWTHDMPAGEASDLINLERLRRIKLVGRVRR
jgi:hypothetical protein